MTTAFMTRRRLLGAGLCGTLTAPAWAAGDAAPSTHPALRVGAGQPFARIADALRQAVDGDTIEVLPGIYAGDVAVINQRRLTLRGVGERPLLLADGKSAEGKAILVVRNGDILIDNLEFRGARVPDRNGAGIRFEKGTLTVRNCHFINNENGILTANYDDARLRIEDSHFAQAPDRPDSLDHLIYVRSDRAQLPLHQQRERHPHRQLRRCPLAHRRQPLRAGARSPRFTGPSDLRQIGPGATATSSTTRTASSPPTTTMPACASKTATSRRRPIAPIHWTI